jgi:hypothetical protein
VFRDCSVACRGRGSRGVVLCASVGLRAVFSEVIFCAVFNVASGHKIRPLCSRFAPHLLPCGRVIWLNAVGYSLLGCNVVNISYIYIFSPVVLWSHGVGGGCILRRCRWMMAGAWCGGCLVWWVYLVFSLFFYFFSVVGAGGPPCVRCVVGVRWLCAAVSAVVCGCGVWRCGARRGQGLKRNSMRVARRLQA